MKKSGVNLLAIAQATLIFALPLACIALFFFRPLANILTVSFSGVFGAAELNFKRIGDVFTFTAWQAFLSTLFTLLLGLPAAYIVSRYRFFGKRFLSALFSIPFILPAIVTATAFNALIGPKGWINQFLMHTQNLTAPPVRAFNTLEIIIVAHVFYNVSVVIRMVGNAWAGLDTRYEEAARVLGASPVQTFRRVILPLLRPTIQSATLIVFLFDFTSYGVVLLLGGGAFRTVEVEISQQALLLLNMPMAATLSVLQLLVTFTVTLLDQLTNRTVASLRIPKVHGENLRPIRGIVPRLSVSLYILALALFLGLPLLALVVRSLYLFPAEANRIGVAPGWTLTFYQQLFINERKSYFYVSPLRALWNSLETGALTGIVTTGIAGLIVFGENRFPRLRRLEWLFMLSIGTSAVTLGLGYLITFRGQVRNPLLMVMAHSLIALPFAIRSIKPAFAAIPRNLRDSGAMLGASPLKSFFLIELPLLKSGLLTAFIFSMTVSLGEFGASSFMTTPERPTIPIAIYRYLGQPGPKNFGQAMALSTILLCLCLVSIQLIERTGKDSERAF